MPSPQLDDIEANIRDDVQGNILYGYRFPHARFVLLHIENAQSGRTFVGEIAPRVTRAHWGREKPDGATNIAFTYSGLKALDLPDSCLGSFSRSFIEGMSHRAWSLGDTIESWPNYWSNGDVHCLVSLYGSASNIESHLETFESALPSGIRRIDVQAAALPEVNGKILRLEHFGFTDGLSNPLIEGTVTNPGTRIGNPDGTGKFRPVALGEFLLGHPDEGRELSPMPFPHEFSRNGTFMVYRKLRQYVARFDDFLEKQTESLKKINPSADKEWLAAKLLGRRKDGTSLIHTDDPTSNEFGYSNDPDGAECPLGSHIRRSNPRDALGFDGALSNRHRIIRRGIPYGRFHKENEKPDDSEDRGIIFIVFNASIDRQFEFVQRQWIEQGEDFNQGNDKDPIAGNNTDGKVMVQGQNVGKDVRPPFLCRGLGQFVEATGGAYFFVPSMTALNLMARGLVNTV
jgi:Dyp-type peroxidase family